MVWNLLKEVAEVVDPCPFLQEEEEVEQTHEKVVEEEGHLYQEDVVVLWREEEVEVLS